MTNLNPVWKVGYQITEALEANGVAKGKAADERVVELLEEAGLPDAERRARQYPHEFSGGMRQRALIAIGLAARPKLLIADEPTSALDVTVQQQILDHLDELTDELGVAVLLITHDLGLAAERAEHLVVMYRGRIVESGPALRDPDGSAAPVHPAAGRLGAVAVVAAAAVRARQGAGGGGEQLDVAEVAAIAADAPISAEAAIDNVDRGGEPDQGLQDPRLPAGQRHRVPRGRRRVVQRAARHHHGDRGRVRARASRRSRRWCCGCSSRPRATC